jgi:hypothetical protein
MASSVTYENQGKLLFAGVCAERAAALMGMLFPK